MIFDFHRAVYFGRVMSRSEQVNGALALLVEDMRHLFYFVPSADGHRGVYGLATAGPASGCKIGPPCSAEIRDVVKIVQMTPEAVEKLDKIKW